jgi:putative ABC transport system permease protein
MKGRGFYFFFRKSITQRTGRVVIASLSVMLAVATVTGLIGITAGIKDKLGSELQAYGANLILSPEKGDYLNHDMLKTVSSLDSVEYASGQVFGRVFIHKESAEIIGLDMKRMRESGWRLEGSWPVNEKEIIAGVNLKEVLKIDKGEGVSFQHGKKVLQFIVSGFVERGGPEDNAFIVSIPQAWNLMGIDGKFSAILVRGTSGELEGITAAIKNGTTGIRVKTLRQVAVAEESLLKKIQLLMILVTAVVLFAAIVSIMSTMGANVLERREEIGLMKAIGATKNNIRFFYIVEAVLIGFGGGIAGYILGYSFAQAVSWGAFHSFISVPYYLVIVSITAGMSISLLSSHFPVSDALKYNPAVILREE